MTRSTSSTMMVAAASPWKSVLRTARPVEDLDRQDGVAPLERARQEGHEADGPDEDERRGLADRAGHGQDDAGQDAGRGRWQDGASDHLPARRAERVGGLALRVWAPLAWPPSW